MIAQQVAQTTPDPTETERYRRIWNRQARRYDVSMGFWEHVIFRNARAWACSRASGNVLEIAVGTGRNLPYYADDVQLTGFDISEAMLEKARKRAKELGRTVDLRLGDAHAIAFPDATFDTVVSTFSLCSIPDDRLAISEIKRVLRPGGRVVLAEHVRSPNAAMRGVEHVLEFVSDGDHFLREPVDGLRAEGFVIDVLERRVAGFVELLTGHKR